MYCPKCAAQNAEDIRYCRVCGANLSLVPQALTGQLPEAPSGRHRRRRDHEDSGPPNVANGIGKIISGLGFILVACAVFFFAPAGRIWWFWMLVPAFGMIGKGVAEILGAKYARQMQPSPPQSALPPVVPHVRNTGELSPPPVYNPLPPPSITEGTTRHLDPTTDQYPKNR